jgi:hypothetical protein
MSQQLGNEVERQGKPNKSTTPTTAAFLALHDVHNELYLQQQHSSDNTMDGMFRDKSQKDIIIVRGEPRIKASNATNHMQDLTAIAEFPEL